MTEVFKVEAHGRSYLIQADPESLIGRRLAVGRPYEPILLEHIYAEHFDGLAIDVGAHIGNHALWLARVCGLRVAAFEPLHFGWLEDNVNLNGLDDAVTVHRVALGALPGRATDAGDRVLTALGESEEARGRPERAEGRLKVGDGPVEVRTLDSYGFKRVSVIKIDVEDMEPEVLRGARTTIARNRPVIYAEARNDACSLAINVELGPLGYRVTQRFHRGTRVERWDP